MQKKPAKSKSWDTIATRELWGAISRKDPVALGRALGKGGNPNDQKRINSWDPPRTPLMLAVEQDFADGIAPLVRAGARRRSAGKQSLSVFAAAVANDSASAFKRLVGTLGALTGVEALECCIELRSMRGTGAEEKKEAWGNLLLHALDAYPIRFPPAVALSIAAELLGGSSLVHPPLPHLARQLIDRGLLAPSLLARATDCSGLDEWGGILAKRTRPAGDEVETVALDMLHELEFPFHAVRGEDAQAEAWLGEQLARMQARKMDAATTKVVGASSYRQRL